MHRWFVLVCCLLAMLRPVSANDTGVSGIGGSWAPLKGEHPSIRMVRENIQMDIRADGQYDVQADFVFRNEGAKATTVYMGFPESGYGDIGDGKSTSFSNFATWVDGQRTAVQRRLTQKRNPTEADDYKALWVKRVAFTKGQTRRVRVRYRSYLGGTSMPHVEFANYNFTGGNWRGKVEESTLSVELHAPGTYLIRHDTPAFQKREGNRLFYRWRNWEAQHEFSFEFLTTLPGWMTREPEGNDYAMGVPRKSLFVVNIPGKLPRPGKEPVRVFRMPELLHHEGTTYALLMDVRSWLERETKYGGGGLKGQFQIGGEEAPQAKLAYGGNILRLTAGKREALLNDKPLTLAAPPLLVRNNRFGDLDYLYVPLKPIADFFGMEVTVDPAKHQANYRRKA
jgi:hypothetical protein